MAAERGHGIPPQLMAAIGRVESGRRDPATGAWGAWPWTINSEGQGSYFDTKADAIRSVQALQARGVRSIDVGCMQVNLMHHPSAFPNLDLAFEPAVNADYAARFLVQLHDQSGDWTKATASYHSANPWEGGPYAAKVTSIWPEEQRKASLNPPIMPGSGRVVPLPGSVQSFPGRPMPRMFAMAGLTPGVMPPGLMPPGMMPTEPVRQGMTAPRTMPLGMMQAGVASGVPSAGLGRGLEFYRAMPIRVMTPMRLVARLPVGGLTR